jgi:hypothetical protein
MARARIGSNGLTEERATNGIAELGEGGGRIPCGLAAPLLTVWEAVLSLTRLSR